MLPKNIVTNFFASALFLVGIHGLFPVGNVAFASNPAACEESKISSALIPLAEMVKKASFIGMYYASSSELTDVKLDNNAGLLARTEFTSLGNSIKGEPPKTLSLLGTPSSNSIPPYYYATNRRHDSVDRVNPAYSGRIPLVSIGGGAECLFAPHFVEGFGYLIFGGIDTPMSYEVIFDAQLNNWYKMVVEEARASETAE